MGKRYELKSTRWVENGFGRGGGVIRVSKWPGAVQGSRRCSALVTLTFRESVVGSVQELFIQITTRLLPGTYMFINIRTV